jgi:DNA mismatch endonuclease (patch repair protein)
MDTLTKERRSWNMARIRARDTRPELLVRSYLHKQGFRFRVHVKDLPGTPDIVLPKYKTLIFIQGCFWHGHEGCKEFRLPKTRTEWWAEKITRNKKKEAENSVKLDELGWNSLVIWTCELRKPRREETLRLLSERLRTGSA